MNQVLRALQGREQRLLARRCGPPDMAGAVHEALAEACGGPPPPGFEAAGLSIAAIVEAHGAAFAPGSEPAYHDRHHQAEATLAAGWLGRAAVQRGLVTVPAAGLLVLAMAGHDLQHDGREHADAAMERHSAGLACRLAGGLGQEARAELYRLIMATWPGAPGPDDPCARMAREADLFGSLTPWLGWRLSRALACERAAAGIAQAAATATHAGRLALLRSLPPMSAPAAALGLEAGRAAQIAAIRQAGARSDPAAAAAVLDAMPRAEADARWRTALEAQGLAEPVSP